MDRQQKLYGKTRKKTTFVSQPLSKNLEEGEQPAAHPPFLVCQVLTASIYFIKFDKRDKLNK